MPECRVCSLPAIEREQLRQSLQSGESLLGAEKRTGISRNAIGRHYAVHEDIKVRNAVIDEAPSAADAILDQLRTLQNVTKSILATAMKDEQHRTALASVREASRLLRQQSELEGRLQRMKMTVSLDMRLSADWQTLTRAAAVALKPFPEARRAFSDALKRLRPKP